MKLPPIRVLIVDDSSVIRMLLTKILASDADIEVVGTAADPYIAREKLISLKPDVMTLDIEMPRMDGITFLERVMMHMPTRTIMISSLSATSSAMALKSLAAGAIDIIEKPSLDVGHSLELMSQEILAKVKMAAKANLSPCPGNRPPRKKPESSSALEVTTHLVIAIASSTGGTEALKVLLAGMPSNIPGTVIVQHMPPVFTKTYAEALNSMFPFEVKEAEDGDRVVPGRVLIAPGNFHMELARSGAVYFVKLHQEDKLHGVRPAADYLMKSVSKFAGSNSIGVILTGMGKDGAAGLLEMRQAGAYTLAQDEASCVVFGMPKAAIDLGAVEHVIKLPKMADMILMKLRQRKVS